MGTEYTSGNFAHFEKSEKYVPLNIFVLKKSHTCEEAGAHLGISFWHLLMNLKNKYLLKNC